MSAAELLAAKEEYDGKHCSDAAVDSGPVVDGRRRKVDWR